jgi:hypothetical protein
VSTTRFADAVAALLAAYQNASGLSGVPVYDGPSPSMAADLDFIVVGHDASLASDGSLQGDALAGIYLQDWTDMTSGREERGSVNCVIVSQTGDSGDTAGRRARAAVLLAACEDAAASASASHLTFDGTTDGRFIYRQGIAGVAVLAAYRVSYSAPWD